MAEWPMRQIKTQIHVPSFAELPRTGVYFLLDGNEIVYIGQAVDIRRRIADHIGEGLKSFDGVDAIACRPSQLLALEREYIEAILPKYNRCSYSESLRIAGRKCAGSSPIVRLPVPRTERVAALRAASKSRQAAKVALRR